MKLEFSPQAMKDLAAWKKADRKTLEKLLSLLTEITITPFTGRGQPEQLRYELSGYWSRRINIKDRIVYKVDEVNEVIYIASLRGHYSR